MSIASEQTINAAPVRSSAWLGVAAHSQKTSKPERPKTMIEYDIPENVKALFANGERSYRIEDPDQAGDNIFAMNLFLECVGVPAEMVECDDGTQVTLFDGTTRIVIDSGGLGDFHLHGYDVTVATPNDEVERLRL